MTQFSTRFLLAGITYVVLGMLLGMYMGAHMDFVYAPMHAHMNLLGWVTMALFAYYYNAVPKAAETRLAEAHFWIAQAGLILMVVGLGFVLRQKTQGEPVLIVGEILTVISMLIFAVTVWRNRRPAA